MANLIGFFMDALAVGLDNMRNVREIRRGLDARYSQSSRRMVRERLGGGVCKKHGKFTLIKHTKTDGERECGNWRECGRMDVDHELITEFITHGKALLLGSMPRHHGRFLLPLLRSLDVLKAREKAGVFSTSFACAVAIKENQDRAPRLMYDTSRRQMVRHKENQTSALTVCRHLNKEAKLYDDEIMKKSGLVDYIARRPFTVCALVALYADEKDYFTVYIKRTIPPLHPS